MNQSLRSYVYTDPKTLRSSLQDARRNLSIFSLNYKSLRSEYDDDMKIYQLNKSSQMSVIHVCIQVTWLSTEYPSSLYKTFKLPADFSWQTLLQS